MASGSRGRCRGRGRGSRALGGAPPALAAAAAAPAPAPFIAGVSDPQIATLSAVDLVARLIRCNRRASDFVDAALVLAARERRLAEAEARARAAEEDAARLRCQIAAEAEIRRLVVVTELRLRSEIRTWQRRAAEAEARLEAVGAGGVVADLTEEEEGNKPRAEEEGRREEAPLQAVSGKRKEAMDLSLDKRIKNLIKLGAGGGQCSNAVLPASEANTIDEAEDEEAWEDQDALAVTPVIRCDVHDGLEMGTNKRGVGEDDKPEVKEMRQATPASASQPNLRCWLYSPLPEKSVDVEERPDDDNDDAKDAPQQ